MCWDTNLFGRSVREGGNKVRGWNMKEIKGHNSLYTSGVVENVKPYTLPLPARDELFSCLLRFVS